MAIFLGDIKCEIREIRLNNKPDHMIEVSPKGTVPVLILKNKVIDESIDIINWVMEQKNIFEDNLDKKEMHLTDALINLFDTKFKYHLDRYKYSNRYEDVDLDIHRNECLSILLKLESILDKDKWIFSQNINKLDIAILPFIRQFKIADPEWFENQIDIMKVNKLLNKFLYSDLFNNIMYKYEVWKTDSKAVFFPMN
jgi:glutathione S-transferase